MGIVICFVAYNGAEAVKKFVECSPKPQVILMDYRLPVVDGIEATIEILKIAPGTKIVFLSDDNNLKDDALAAGAFIILKKPASNYDVTHAIQSVLSKRKS
jgi:two-component system, chemotaxis family, chemotaxis protein CheY